MNLIWFSNTSIRQPIKVLVMEDITCTRQLRDCLSKIFQMRWKRLNISQSLSGINCYLVYKRESGFRDDLQPKKNKYRVAVAWHSLVLSLTLVNDINSRTQPTGKTAWNMLEEALVHTSIFSGCFSFKILPKDDLIDCRKFPYSFSPFHTTIIAKFFLSFITIYIKSPSFEQIHSPVFYYACP